MGSISVLECDAWFQDGRNAASPQCHLSDPSRPPSCHLCTSHPGLTLSLPLLWSHCVCELPHPRPPLKHRGHSAFQLTLGPGTPHETSEAGFPNHHLQLFPPRIFLPLPGSTWAVSLSGLALLPLPDLSHLMEEVIPSGHTRHVQGMVHSLEVARSAACWAPQW